MSVCKANNNFRYMQYYAAISSTMSGACGAVYVSWASPSLPRLTSDDSPIGTTITLEEGSWIVSSLFLGSILGSFIAGILMHKISTKQCIFFTGIPYIVGSILIIFAKSAIMLIAAQIIAGIGSGIAFTIVPVYIAEIAEKDIRGKLTVLGIVLINIINFTILGFGPFISYNALALLCSVFPLIFIVTFYFVPESPYYLIKIGEKDAAMRHLKKLASTNTDEKILNMRLEEIEETIQCDMKNKSTLWELLSKKNYRKSLLLMMGIKLLRSFNGTPAIAAYKQTIIESSNSSISPGVSSIIFGLVNILAVCVCAFSVDKMGRKFLLAASALGCAIALVAEGAYFYLKEAHMNITYLSWLPTTALSIYLFLNNIGVSTLSNILMGELFASNIKEKAVSLFTILTSILGFIVLKTYEPLSDSWGRSTVFWLFAVTCILGAIFTLLFLPETKGKSFMEIQKKLNKVSENI